MRLVILGLSVILLTALPSGQIVFNPTEPVPYEKGVYCTPKGKLVFGTQTSDDPCSCKNMLRESKDGCCDVPVTNDPVCRQYCTEKNCACPKVCIPGQKDETQTPPTPSEPVGPNQ